MTIQDKDLEERNKSTPYKVPLLYIKCVIALEGTL